MATPVFCCGAECGQIGLQGQHWAALSIWSISTTTKRNGERSFRYNPAAANATLTGPTGELQPTKVWRWAIMFATLPNADCIISWFPYNGAQAGIGFKVSDSTLRSAVVISGVITFGSTGVVVTTGQFYVCTAKTVGSVVTGTSDIQVNNTACGQASGAFLGANTNEGPKLGSNGVNITADIFFDDFVLSDTEADYPIGDGYVNHFVPTSDGTHNIAGAADFRRGDTTTDILNTTTTAWQLVDDVPMDDVTPDTNDHIRIVAPANASDYVELVFGPAPGISIPTVAPRFVEFICEVFAAGTGLSDEIVRLNDNGQLSDVYVGTQVAGVITGIYKRRGYSTAFLGGPWVIGGLGAGDFNDLRLRYGYATDANPDKSLMCAMIEAEFAPAAAPTPKPIIVRQAVRRAATW